jgi:hypothetical protein
MGNHRGEIEMNDFPAVPDEKEEEANHFSWWHHWTKWHDRHNGVDDYGCRFVEQERRCLDCGKLQLRRETAW